MKHGAAISAAFAAIVSLWAGPAFAAPEGEFTYIVQPDDTLYHLARDYLLDPRSMSEVRSTNRIRNPRRLQIGQPIKIPRRLLKYEPVELTLQSFNGPVSISRSGEELVAKIGQALREGSVISTGANGFAAVGSQDGTLVTVPSNSRIQIIDARHYVINEKIDVQIRVLEGRGEAKAPKIEGDARFRVGTPIAVTAVRGTEFRVAYSEINDLSLTEVIEGEVAVNQGDQSLIAALGEGVAASPQGNLTSERLLNAPVLADGGRIQTDEQVKFSIEGIDGATAYRTQLARDAGFIEIIDQTISTAPLAAFEGVEDGRYFVRSRGVAESGLEGFSRPYTFRRKRVGAEAGAEPSPFADSFKFGWRADGSGDSFHGFQLWNGANPGSLLVDEVAIKKSAILIGDLPPGTYFWRVATMQIDEGEVIKVWTPAQQFSVGE
ncbi:MAG: LysM peptidoglycan-binding domain-containing protein [Altererythrobacter sp.]|nr:LysM peptidoglycan-binding domain-containing protein [Altererythrobacter sp.]